MSHKGRFSLRQGMDREVYQVVRKLQDDTAGRPQKLTIYNVYDSISSSNSSLKRKPKKLLEDSIERVLAVLKEDQADQDTVSSAGNLSDIDSHERELSAASNAMNKNIIGSWSSNTPQSTGDSTKKREVAANHLKADDGPPKKKKKKVQASDTPETVVPAAKLEDIGGVEDVKEQLRNHLILPLIRPKRYIERKIPIPRGILLHGPPGCGKTALSRAYAATIGVPFIEILGPSVVSGMSGESEKQIRDHFEEAKRQAPSILFIDEIDTIANKRSESQSQMEKRIVAQLLISMDGLGSNEKPVIVLAATNRPDSLDPALRRGGRFDTEINMGVPNEYTREQILRAQTREIKLAPNVDFAQLAKMTPGFVGADIRDLVGKAGTWSMDRYREALDKQAIATESNDEQRMEVEGVTNERTSDSAMDRSIRRLVKRAWDFNMKEPEGFEDDTLSMEAFLAVLPEIQPSSKREGFATIPDTTWEDIGALKEVREELQVAIVEPIKAPEKFEQVGIAAPTGVLLWGPPGCGKTLLAKAVANESKANFISVKGPELINKYVGESERAVRQLFTRARSSVPCVILLDEVDSIIPRREDALSEASTRVVNMLLTELDGLSARQGIWVIAATNRPDIIDPAMLRPGRLETLLYVGLPGANERVEILRALLRKKPIDDELAEVARVCDGFSGADLGSLLRKSGQLALKRAATNFGSKELPSVKEEDFRAAIKVIKPSIRDIKKYEKLKETLSRI
ncbi:MAG: hypothetical protein M1820_010618 [Bogoriella megaspora]|nr:MAG: hypothetical protein M1820_010618 [Bogoriella megaspora]